MDSQLIDKIKDTARIEDIINDYVPLKPSGKNRVGKCPFHADSGTKLSVSPNLQIYKCFSCGAGGNVFTFLMKYKNIGFIDAVKAVAQKYHIDINQ